MVWTRALEDHEWTSTSALEIIPILLGPAHRLAWAGPDSMGDRPRAARLLHRCVEEVPSEHRGLAAVIDWWLVAALGETPGEYAWSIDRHLPGPLGERLREVLNLKGGQPLRQLRAPFELERTLNELERLADTHSGKIAPAIRILKEAGAECHNLVRAAREGEDPPANLRLAGLSENALETWAGEAQAGRKVDSGTPVWDHLTRSLRERANLVDRALELWSARRVPKICLPPGWRSLLEAHLGQDADLAALLLADLQADSTETERFSPNPAWFAEEPPARARLRAYGLAREALGSNRASWTPWMLSAEAELKRMDAEIDKLDGTATAEFIAEARNAVADLDLEAAHYWLVEAHAEAQKQEQTQHLLRRRERLREIAHELRAIGASAPLEELDLDQWETHLDHAAHEARAEIEAQFQQLALEVLQIRRSNEVESRIHSFRQQIPRSLAAAKEALDGLKALRAHYLQADQDRLGSELFELRTQILAAGTVGLLPVIDLGASRRAAGLSTQTLVDRLRSLLRCLQAGELPPIIQAEPPFADGPLYLETATPVSGPLVGEPQILSFAPQLRLYGGKPGQAVGLLRAWGLVGGNRTELPFLFEERAGRVRGPFAPGSAGRQPARADGAVASLPRARFEILFGRVDLADGAWLVPFPPSLEELDLAGATLEDPLDDEVLAAWLKQEATTSAPTTEILACIKQLAQQGDLPPGLHRVRKERLNQLLARSQSLSETRTQVVQHYLESSAGKAAIEAAIESRIAAEMGRVRVEVASRRLALEAELAQVQSQIDERRRNDGAEREAHLAGLRAIDTQVEEAKALLADQKTRFLVEWMAEVRPQTVPPPEQPSPPTAEIPGPIQARRFPTRTCPPIPELVAELAADTLDPSLVANLLLSTLTGPWTLLAGLPGVGKSHLARSFLHRVGHGVTSGRCLELVVRKDWQDDTALFGFWHPTQASWEPSSEGFLEHLLMARDDEQRGLGGWYPVLIEELNLASPEYYLARPISALEAEEPIIRLYGEGLSPKSAPRYPAAFHFPNSVRLIGTVNVDDTVERLSPRFLSRASVIWIDPPTRTARPQLPTAAPPASIRWPELQAALPGPVEDLGELEHVLRFLTEQRIAGAPTYRARAAIARFIGASSGLIPRTEAEDLQILQRVLPPLRGVGPRWRTILDRLALHLDRGGWVRSAARVRELRARGEELGDWYDFFHT